MDIELEVYLFQNVILTLFYNMQTKTVISITCWDNILLFFTNVKCNAKPKTKVFSNNIK